VKFILKHKKAVISAVALLVAGSVAIGLFAGNSGNAVNVYAFQYIGMTEYWGDNQESYGPVSTDKIQTVFLSDTQTVTEIKVAAGDTVKKGDILMSFDTTLDDLALERKRLDVERQKLQLQNAQKRLQEIRNMVPMVIPEFNEEEEEPVDLGVNLVGDYEISAKTEFDGSSEEKAMICWLKDVASINNELLETLRIRSAEYREENETAIPVFETAIPMTVKVGEAVYYSRPVLDYAPNCSASIAYKNFAKELDKKMNHIVPIQLHKLTLPANDTRKAVKAL